MNSWSLFFFLLSIHLSQSGGWGILVGRNRWNTMKYTSSAGRHMRTELTKLKALKTTMGATISTLGLIGTLAIYKKIESQLDPSETEQIAIIQSLISKVK